MRIAVVFAFSLLITGGVLFADSSVAGDMVLVEGGTFTMGSPSIPGPPPHKVSLDSFYMDRYETTAIQWKQFVEAEGMNFPWKSANFRDLLRSAYYKNIPDQMAMFSIDWYEAILYCNWRSRQEGLRPAYILNEELVRKEVRSVLFIPVSWDVTANGYRLPTEAEWEYAAQSCLPNDATNKQPIDMNTIGWGFDELGMPLVETVGMKQPNKFGIYDMIGNPIEWCWDYYDPTYYGKSPQNNPRGPSIGFDAENDKPSNTIRVVRGVSAVDGKLSFDDVFMRIGASVWMRGFTGVRLVRSYFPQQGPEESSGSQP